VNELIEQLRTPFTEDKEYRSAYAESFMNSSVAAQIKVLREQRELSQQELADLIGTKQAGISRLENVNYTSWKVETLTRLARAFDVRLRITFEEFGTLPDEVDRFGRHSLQREAFENDPVFGTSRALTEETLALTKNEMDALAPTTSNVIGIPKTPPATTPNGETYATIVDSPSKSIGVHRTGGIEPWRQGVSTRSSEGADRALSLPLQQQLRHG
jgi:transcriptional regulator with XRE-family HTH domain